jgi:two-component system heavy metal sensor histidine kinase CusS
LLRALSLTQRLAIFFTVLAAAVVFGLGLVVVEATARHFVDLDRATLLDKQHLIEDIVQSATSADDTKWRLDEALSHHHGLYVVVKDAHGGLLYRSPGFRSPGPGQPPTPSPGDGAEGHLQHWASGGQEYRAIRFQVAPAYEPRGALEVLAAIDTEHHEHFLAELRRTLLWYALLAVAVSGLLGWLAAHQGLAPLRAMRARAAAVSGHRFSARMPVAAVPIEMADLAAELNGMLDRLQEDYRRLAEFSSDLAHELRTPISNLLTQTQVALSTKRDAPTYRNILASNAEELERMARMVADMLFLAKAERGMPLPNRERFSAAQEVQALLEFYDAVAEEKGIGLSVKGDGEIEGDRLMFRRAVSNLLSNAVRHADAGSPVTVRIDSAEDGVSVSVANRADDIHPSVLPRLFDRFFRGDPSRAHPASEGAGLGLSITKAIVEAHAGRIEALSQDRTVRIVMRFPTPPAPLKADGREPESHRGP